MVRRRNLNGRGQVENDAIFSIAGFTPRFEHGITYLDSEVGLRLAESFGAVIKYELGPMGSGDLIGQPAEKLYMVDSESDRFLFAVIENDLSPNWGGGIVKMYYGFLRPFHTFNSAFDEWRSGWSHNLY